MSLRRRVSYIYMYVVISNLVRLPLPRTVHCQVLRAAYRRVRVCARTRTSLRHMVRPAGVCRVPPGHPPPAPATLYHTHTHIYIQYVIQIQRTYNIRDFPRAAPRSAAALPPPPPRAPRRARSSPLALLYQSWPAPSLLCPLPMPRAPVHCALCRVCALLSLSFSSSSTPVHLDLDTIVARSRCSLLVVLIRSQQSESVCISPRTTRSLAFTRYCYYQSCMVYSIQKGVRGGAV